MRDDKTRLDARESSQDIEWGERGVSGPSGKPAYHAPLAERFWRRVRKGDGCWEWTGASSVAGYGKIYHPDFTKPRGAHRVSWELHFGPIPDGLWVLHRCDNPPCVRPDHLFLGTCQDNNDDKVAKGRHPVGERSAAAVLTEADVLEIRRLYATGEHLMTELAARYGVTPGAIQALFCRNWQHVAEDRDAAKRALERRKAAQRPTFSCGTCGTPVVRAAATVRRSRFGKAFCNQSCIALYNNQHRAGGKPITEAEIAAIREMASRGVSISKIAKTIGRDFTFVKARYDVRGVEDFSAAVDRMPDPEVRA